MECEESGRRATARIHTTRFLFNCSARSPKLKLRASSSGENLHVNSWFAVQPIRLAPAFKSFYEGYSTVVKHPSKPLRPLCPTSATRWAEFTSVTRSESMFSSLRKKAPSCPHAIISLWRRRRVPYSNGFLKAIGKRKYLVNDGYRLILALEGE